MGWFRRKSAPDEAFAHASGHESLRDVIQEQSPTYDEEHGVVRPRGRAARLHPDAPAITRSKQRELEAQQRTAEIEAEAAAELTARPPAHVRTLWRNDTG